jgi:hypothetical protein
MPVKFYDLDAALEFVSFDGGYGNAAYLCRQTGEIYYKSEDGEDELPEDYEDGTKYIHIPDKKDLDLGSRLVFQFVREFMPDDYGHVRNMFSRRGAYGQFKNFLTREGMLDRWHQFEAKAHEEALREWCADNGIEIEE